jgi:hypothetical protein
MTIQDLLARVPSRAERTVDVELAIRAVGELGTSQPAFTPPPSAGRTRHDAVDKAVGALLARRLVGRGQAWPTLAILAVSGRASFEIVQKAAAAGIACGASASAPGSLAVDLARQAGMVLLGFVRGGGWNAYAGGVRAASHAGVVPAPGP